MKRGVLIKLEKMSSVLRRVLRRSVCAVAFASVFSMGISAQNSSDVLKLDLNNAIQIALSENPTIVIADQQVELKKISKNEAWQSLLPTVDFGGSVQYTVLAAVMKLNDMEFKMGKDNTSTWNGQFQVSLPIFAPTVYATMNLTTTDLEQAVEQGRSSRLDLVNQVTKAFYSLMLAQDSYEVLQQSYAQAERNFEVVNAMFALGGVSEYDKISAEVQMRNLKPSVLSAKNAVSIAKLQLRVLMGVSTDVDIQVEGSLTDFEEQMYVDLLTTENYSLDNNTNVRQLAINHELLNRTLKVQRMNFLPTLAMQGSYTFQTLNNDDFNIADYNWSQSSSVALSLSIPIFRMGNFTKIRSTKLQISQLEQNRVYTERQLKMQVESCLNSMRSSTEMVASNREAIVQAEKGREIAEKRYEIGNGTILELNNSEVSLTQAKLTYSQSIYDYLSAKADLDKVLGRDEAIQAGE